MAPQDIEQYVGWVLDQKPENANLDPEVRKQLESDYVASLEDQVNAAILAALPKDDLITFEHLLDTATASEIQKFTERKIPDIQELVAGVLVRFKVSYLGV